MRAATLERPYERLAPLFDELLGDRFFVELRRTFEWVVRRYGLRFDTAADIGCGTGTFVGYLRGIGVRTVWGVDYSPEMLRVAVAKNAGTGARFLRQDMRKLRLPYRVDLITSHFDTLNYMLDLADLRAALRSFGDNLDCGGHAIFDLVTERLTGPGTGPTVERARRPGMTITRVTHRDPVRRLQTASVKIRRGDSVTEETHVQRGYSIREVGLALRGSGMRLRAVHDYHHPTRPPGLAERAVYVTRRARP